MSDILLSIIVPVYNVENYLDVCINSILSSGFTEDCELILVDDGSTDGSGLICDHYFAENVFILHKENGGLSSARNAGLKLARGKYIAFIDSDDYVAENAIANILCELKYTNGVDVYFMQADKVYSNGTEVTLGDGITSQMVNGRVKLEALDFLSKCRKFPGSACTKLFNRHFLMENCIEFPKDNRRAEDLIFTLKCIYLASNYGAMDFPYYKYRQQRKGSITSRLTEKGYEDVFSFFDDAIELLTTDHVCKDDYAEKCMSFVAYEYCLLVWKLTHIDKLSQKKMILKLNTYKWLLNYSASKKAKVIRIMIITLGYRLTSTLLTVIKSWQVSRSLSRKK